MEKATGTRPLFLPCDITDMAALQATIAAAATAHGPITVLVNNAANDKRHDTLKVDEAFWDWSIAINLKAYFFAAQAVIPGMQAAGGGSIINFTSISYMFGDVGYPVYTAANSGINGMTRTLAREFGPDRIRVNALAPGWVLTQKQKDLWVTPEGLAAHLDPPMPERHAGARRYRRRRAVPCLQRLKNDDRTGHGHRWRRGGNRMTDRNHARLDRRRLGHHQSARLCRCAEAECMAEAVSDDGMGKLARDAFEPALMHLIAPLAFRHASQPP